MSYFRKLQNIVYGGLRCINYQINGIKRFGTKYGGYYYPKKLPGLNQKSIIYSVGVGEDISHDIELLSELNCTYVLIDPTPRAATHMNEIRDYYQFNTKSNISIDKLSNFSCNISPEYKKILQNYTIELSKITFLELAIGVKNDIMKFYKPQNQNYVSHSLVEGMKSNEFINVNVRNLRTIMNKLSHDRIDLLKIDVEGMEHQIIDYILTEKIFPMYLSVDFDKAREKAANAEFEKTLHNLKIHGYKIISNIDYDISFRRDVK